MQPFTRIFSKVRVNFLYRFPNFMSNQQERLLAWNTATRFINFKAPKNLEFTDHLPHGRCGQYLQPRFVPDVMV